MSKEEDKVHLTNTPTFGDLYENEISDELSANESQRNSLRFLYGVAALAAIGSFLFGYDLGVISGALIFIIDDFRLDDVMTEVVVSSLLIGGFFGSIIGGPLNDKMGRKKIVILASILFILGSLLMSVSPTTTTFWLLLGRIIAGTAIGIAAFTVPMYLAELSPAEFRGALVSINELFVTVGVFMSFVVDFGLSSSGSGNWRWMLGLAIVPAVVQLLGMSYLPESPRWLLYKGRDLDAKKVLKHIRKTKDIEDEFQNIKESIRIAKKSTYKDLFRSSNRKPLTVGIGLVILQQITGQSTVIYYSSFLLKSVFQSSSKATFGTAVIGLVKMLVTVVCIKLVDKVGRKPLLLSGVILMSLSLVFLGFTYLLSYSGWISIVCLMMYLGGYSLGFGPITWLLMSEIFPLRLRAKSMALTTSINWLANLLVSLTFLSMLDLFGTYQTFWIYAAIGIFAVIFVHIFVYETKGKTLEELSEESKISKLSILTQEP